MSRLDDALTRLAAEQDQAQAPGSIESAVLAEFDRVQRGRRARRARRWIPALAAVAAAAVIAVWVAEHRPAHQIAASQAVPAQAADFEQPFVPIPYVLPPAPYERVEVVRMQVPVAALIAAGLRIQTADQSAQAEADVMLGQDGRARAIRLISISN